MKQQQKPRQLSSSKLKLLNPKLLQYSFDISYSQSKLIQTKHNSHLKKLQQIQHKSNIPKIKSQCKSLKNLSQSLHKYKAISRNFKQKQFQQKRNIQDTRMLVNISEISKGRQRLYTENVKQHKKIIIRKEVNNKLVNQIKNKQLENQNVKIAKRIEKHTNDNKYINKMEKDIYQYIRLRRHMQKIKQQHSRNNVKQTIQDKQNNMKNKRIYRANTQQSQNKHFNNHNNKNNYHQQPIHNIQHTTKINQNSTHNHVNKTFN